MFQGVVQDVDPAMQDPNGVKYDQLAC